MLPKNIQPSESYILIETTDYYDERIRTYIDDRLRNKWAFYVVDSNRGYCDYKHKVITIPLFAIRRGADYTTWYICHEIAHSLAGTTAKHGPLFMQQLKRICPKEYQKFEYGYKPRNARIAGLDIPIEDLMP